MCDSWRTFDNFLADMGERPDDTSLDRKDSNGDYSTGNCRWATVTEQANNVRSNRNITLNGETLSVTAWCRKLGLSPTTVWARINKWGYTAESALTSPKQDRVAHIAEIHARRTAAHCGT